MRILHLLSQTQVTGAETYAASLIKWQQQHRNEVWILSDTFTTETTAHYQSLPLDNRSLLQRIKNIIAVRRLLRAQQIDVVHAHSRAASWVGYFATRWTRLPLISTIHGKQKPSLSKKLWNMYGEEIIAVSPNVARQITTQLKIKRVTALPNLFDFKDLPKRIIPSASKVIIAGRMTGPKGLAIGQMIQEVLPTLLAIIPSLQIEIAGGNLEQLTLAAQQQWHALTLQYPDQLVWQGFVKELERNLASASLVVAAGRIAITALAIGVPVLAIGEAECVGLVQEDNLQQAINSNFGDMDFAGGGLVFDAQTIISEMTKALTVPTELANIQEQVITDYAIDNICPQIMELYYRARMMRWHPKHIPVLMYHKVLPAPEQAKHRTFVTVKQFDQHMQFLAKHGFTTLTFKDYFTFRDGVRPLAEFPRKPIFITFDDGYVNNLELALPILQKYGFTMVLYVLGDFTVDHNAWDAQHGEPKHSLLTPVGLKKMSAAGIEIGAHSLSHAHLTKLPLDKAWQEIAESKRNLEELIQQPIISFAYPYGSYNQEIEALTQKAGYRCAVATDRGGLLLEDDLFAIFRVNMMPRDHSWEMFKKTRSNYRERYWRKRGK